MCKACGPVKMEMVDWDKDASVLQALAVSGDGSRKLANGANERQAKHGFSGSTNVD